jgi:hypothetical protein
MPAGPFEECRPSPTTVEDNGRIEPRRSARGQTLTERDSRLERSSPEGVAQAVTQRVAPQDDEKDRFDEPER